MADRRRRLGAAGEEAVAEWYRARGYAVLARNWRCPAGEIDLVLSADGGATVVFCEVKTRSGSAFGSPFEAVTAAKQRRLRRLAGRYLAGSGRQTVGRSPRQLRIDVAAVRLAGGGRLHVEVLEDAC